MPEDSTSAARRALVAGALLLPAALSACSGGANEQEVTANEDLMREHGVLRRILILYRNTAPRIAAGDDIDPGALHQAAIVFRDFGEQYHEQLEEQHIFPAIAKAGDRAGGLVAALLDQHRRGREITAYLLALTQGGRIATGQAAAVAAAMTSFARMYETHAAREDTIVFPAFRKTLSGHRYRELGEKFEEIERKRFGGDGFDMAETRVAAIEEALGLGNLADFTAPAPHPAV